MFVPNYKMTGFVDGIAKHGVMVLYNLPCDVAYMFQDGDERLCDRISFENNYKPLTLKCPHCQREIQQAERVECECGWIAEAISEGIKRLLIDACENITLPLIKPKKTTLTFITELSYGSIDDSKDVEIHHINSINWLEIKAGEPHE